MDLFVDKGLFLSNKTYFKNKIECLQHMRAAGVIQKKGVLTFLRSVRHKTFFFLISQLVQVKMVSYSA